MINSLGRITESVTRGIVPGLFLLLFLTGCRNTISEINDVTKRGRAGEDHGRDVTIIYSKGGNVTARLFGRTFIRSEAARQPYTEMRDSVRVEFYDSLRIKNVLTAKYARWYEKDNNILIRDDVHLVSDKGDNLYTSEIIWNQKMQKFFTEKPVRIVTPTRTMRGTGMIASQDFSTFDIENLSGEIQIEKSAVPVTE